MKTDTQTKQIEAFNQFIKDDPRPRQLPAPNKAQHSPLPWEYQYCEHTQEPRVLARSGDMCIATGFGNGPEAEANAALIVRAVNNVDKLAEALRGMLQMTGTFPDRRATAAKAALAAYESEAAQ